MKMVPLSLNVILYVSNYDLKVLEATAISQGYALNRMISEIVKEWVKEHVSSRDHT